ncbi:MAG: rRNA pseudouridine synthase [Burkholderiales bacterium]|nr:rRNA pseudouridine synthase [Burkholderiales bacterium]
MEKQKLHKMLAHSGVGSRRDMEEAVLAGRVMVNGKPAEVGMRVGPEDMIRFDGRIVKLKFGDRLPRVMIYHKPEGEIVSHDDPEKRASVFDKLPRMRSAKWISIGRLDFNTSGLLIFTTSGELANRFTHPGFEVEREYSVRILGRLTPEQEKEIKSGIVLDDGIAKVDAFADEGGEGANHWYRVILKEGRNRVVRRIFEALGLTVSRLIRTRFGPVVLPSRVKRGMTLELPEDEVAALMKWAGLAVPEPKPRPAKRPVRR